MKNTQLFSALHLCACVPPRNDDVIAKKALTDPAFKDLRVVGVMNDSRKVKVPDADNPENNHGRP